MNRIFREHYPVARLPKDLREGLDPKGEVTVTLEKEGEPSRKVLSLEEILAARRPPYRSSAEIDDDIRRSRDGWDE